MTGVWFAGVAGAAGAPEILDEGDFANLVRVPGSSTVWRLSGRFNTIFAQASTDNGTTWSASFNLVASAPGSRNPIPAADNAGGRIHIFKIDTSSPANNLYFASGTPITSFTAQGSTGTGNFGSNMSATVIQSGPYAGRILVPYGSSLVAPPAGFGNNIVGVKYLNPGTTTWSLSPSQLTSPVPSTWNGASDGACEPTIWVRKNGDINMLMRSQTGKLRFSTSSDGGATWLATADSFDYNGDGNPDINFNTSTGPPTMTRLDNGDLVLLWNNATMPPRFNNQIWYAGRDILHAAISSDDGLTWKGFREVYLDPFRSNPSINGDTGTAYSFTAPLANGKLLSISGQADAKTMLRIDPGWLLETNASDDFGQTLEPAGSNPAGGYTPKNWSVFKSIGAVASTHRARENGAIVIDDPDPARTKNVLIVRKPNANDPDGATWNFPMSQRGETTVRLKLQSGFAGSVIALTDRFFQPTDSNGENLAYLKAVITPNAAGGTIGGVQLNAGTWYDVSLDFNTTKNKAILSVDGSRVAVLDSQAGISVWPGLSYLRLRSTASAIDTAGMLIDHVDKIGSNFRDANRTDGANIAGGAAGWTYLKFDDYVPNTLNGNGTTGTFASPYTGIVSAGIVVESSSGTVRFADATSTQVTSDIVGPQQNQTLTFSFVNPANPDQPATVAEVAMRLGSIAASNVNVKVFDIDGNELPDWVFTPLTSGTNTTLGFMGLNDLSSASVIHSIQFSGVGTDDWLIGSFALSPTLFDFGFTDLQVVPEPIGIAIAFLGVLVLQRRRRRPLFLFED